MDERTVGKELFGRWVRLAVARWALHQETAFFQTEAASAVGHPLTAVRQELERLVSLEMLQRVAVPSERRVYYTRIESPLWEVIRVTDGVLGAVPAALDADEAAR